MPRINEYDSQTGAGAVPDVLPANTQEAGQMGRAVQRVGAQISEWGDQEYRRQAQEESSDAMVEASTARQNALEKTNDQVQKGNVNTEEIMGEYQDHVDSISDRYQTGHGRRIFNQEMARTKTLIAKNAIHARSVVAGEKAKNNLLDSRNSDSTALLSNPNAFPTIIESQMAGIDNQVALGDLKQNDADKYKRETGAYLAKSAIEGWANSDPQVALKLLNGVPTKDDPHPKGAFDEYLNGPEKTQLQSHIIMLQHAKDSDAARAEVLKEKARAKKADAWRSDNLERMSKGEVPAVEIFHNPLFSYEEKKEQLAMKTQLDKERLKGNPVAYASIVQRIFLPEGQGGRIGSLRELEPLVADGTLTGAEYTKASKLIMSSQTHKDENVQKRNLMDYMKKELIGADDMGMKDPNGHQYFSDAFDALTKEEEILRAEGKPTTGLYMRGTKESFFNKVLDYKRGSRDVMKAMAAKMKQQSGTKTAVANATATPIAGIPAKLPGEDPMVYIARKNKAMADAAAAPAATPPAIAAPPQEVQSVEPIAAPVDEGSSWMPKMDRMKDHRGGGTIDWVLKQLEEERAASRKRFEANRESLK